MKNQNGNVLILALVMLAVCTMIGLMATRMAQINIILAGNEKTAMQAFYAAESGIQVAIAKANNDCLNNPPCSEDDYVTYADGLAYKFDVIDTGEAIEKWPILEVDSHGTAVPKGVANINARIVPAIIPDIFQSPAALYVNGNLENKGVSGSALGEYSEPLCTADDIWTTENIDDDMEANDYTADVGGTDKRRSKMPKYPFMSAYNVLTKPRPGTVVIDNVQNNMVLGNASKMTQIFFHDGNWQASNLDGYGILVINGDMVTSGNISWHGLIFVRGNSIYNGGGTKEIYGAVIVNGDALINGTVDVRYAYCSIGDDLRDELTKYKMAWWKNVRN